MHAGQVTNYPPANTLMLCPEAADLGDGPLTMQDLAEADAALGILYRKCAERHESLVNWVLRNSPSKTAK